MKKSENNKETTPKTINIDNTVRWTLEEIALLERKSLKIWIEDTLTKIAIEYIKNKEVKL